MKQIGTERMVGRDTEISKMIKYAETMHPEIFPMQSYFYHRAGRQNIGQVR
jgi:hypothetical protein